MNILPFFLFFYSLFLCNSKNINECNKLWGMNNEINGVTVSNIGIYMCIDDPLNIYSLPPINTPILDVLLSDEQLNIQNFNETVQRKFNHTFNSNNTFNYSMIQTTTNSPTPTTPTTTNSPETTTTNSPTITTTNSPETTTTNSPTITTTNSPTTIPPPLITQSFQIGKNLTNNNSNKNISNDNIDIPLIITLSITSIFIILACVRCSPLLYKYCKRKYYKQIKKNNVNKELRMKHPINLNIKEQKKTKRVAPITIPPLNHTIDIPQVITPKRKISLGFNTMGKQEDWYKDTFKEELSEFKDVNPPPSAPRINTPKIPIPTFKANLENIDMITNHEKEINDKIDKMTRKIEDAKETFHPGNTKKVPNMSIREISHVQQRVHSIEKRSPPKKDFRNVRLNSWTTPGQTEGKNN